MIVRRFQASSTREALREVRDALGADALILANRRLPSGAIELVAMIESGVEPAMLPAPFAPRPPATAVPPRRAAAIEAYVQAAQADDPGDDMPGAPFAASLGAPTGARLAESGAAVRATSGAASRAASRAVSGATSGALESARPAAGRVDEPERVPASPPVAGGDDSAALPDGSRAAVASASSSAGTAEAAAAPPLAPSLAAAIDGAAMTEIAAEVRSLRSLVEQQLAGFAWGERSRRSPVETELMRRLLAAGFSTLLARELAETVAQEGGGGSTGETARAANGAAVGAAALAAPAAAATPATLVDAAWKRVRALLFDRLSALLQAVDPCEAGGVFALVGPTGVGKTTTVAKLAARCVLTRGPASAALLTTDGFRIGALDQLRIYGRILGVPVIAVRDESELQMSLGDVAARHLTLIDTVGMSQRDRRVAEQAAMLAGEGRPVQRVLLLSAASAGSTLEDVASRYRAEELDGCILTKIDEAVSLGAVLDVVLRHRIRVLFVTNGQRVPEDLHLPNPLYLIDRALRGREAANPFTPASDAFALVAASGGSGG